MATRGRGRRLTMAFRPQPPSPAETSATGASSGSRYSCLGSESGSSDEESPPAVGVQMALDILDQEEENSGWTPVGRTRRKRTEAEIVQQFWVDAGFPTPASRFWGRRTSSSPATPTANAGMEPSSCRDQEISVVEGSPDREQSPSPVGSTATGLPVRKAPSSPTGIRVSRGPRMGSWRGPLPPRQITPPPVLGQFIASAKMVSVPGRFGSPAPESGRGGEIKGSYGCAFSGSSMCVIYAERARLACGACLGPGVLVGLAASSRAGSVAGQT